MDCVHMRAGVQTQTTFLRFILVIMGCIHLWGQKCELLYVGILAVISSSSLIDLHGPQRASYLLCPGLTWQHDCEQSDPETLTRPQLVSCHHRACAVKLSIVLVWEEHNSYSVTSVLYEHLVVIPSYSAEASLFLFSMLVILLPFFLIGQTSRCPTGHLHVYTLSFVASLVHHHLANRYPSLTLNITITFGEVVFP